MRRAEWTPDVLAELAHITGVRVDAGEEARAEASGDFGRIARGNARGVARPTTANETREVIRFARRRGLAVTARGGGMSQSAQSVPKDGLSLDLRGLRAIGEPNDDRRTITCGPGATWRELLDRLLPLGLAPKVVPLNLDLTVGGVLSAGGFGSTSHRFGPVVSNVASVTVVTNAGDEVVCGRKQERATFDKVLAGVGLHGAIVDAELELRACPSRVRTFYLAYDSLEAMAKDQDALARAGHADHVEGFCAATMHGLRKTPSGRRQPLLLWSYGLHVSIEHADGATPQPEEALRDLSPTRVIHVEDDTAAAFAARYDVRFEAMRATGAWDQPHPWLECLLPFDAALEVIPRALGILPAFLGDGHRLFWVADTDRPAALAFPSRGPFLSLAVLPMGVPPALLGPAMGALKAVHDMVLSAGGTRYRSGWLFAAPAERSETTEVPVSWGLESMLDANEAPVEHGRSHRGNADSFRPAEGRTNR